jgi:hypothetical protein
VGEDYSKATASPRTIRIGDVDYRVAKWGPRDIGDLEAWLKSQVPDPRLMARQLCEGLSDAVALEVWRDLSMEATSWPPDITSRQGNKLLMNSHEGHTQLLWVALRRHNASFTLEQAREIARTNYEVAMQAAALAQPEEDFSPKSPAATEPGAE